MPANKNNSFDYQSLSKSAKNGSVNLDDQTSLRSSVKTIAEATFLTQKSLVNAAKNTTNSLPSAPPAEKIKATGAKDVVSETIEKPKDNFVAVEPVDYGKQQKHDKQAKKAEKDRALLAADNWLARNGHGLTYCGLYLFSILVLFRPYELFTSLGFLAATAFYFAALTVLIYIPTQFATEGSLTILSTEIKCILALTFFAVLTMPLGKDIGASWEIFSDIFIKIVLMFVVMVNVLRTRRRLKGMMWLSMAVGVYLSFSAVYLYFTGKFKTEGYRVSVDIGGLFGNPNDMALHLVTITPLAIALGIASRNRTARLFYFAMAGLFVAANMVTFSRGGFLGLVVSSAILMWKIGRKNRLNVFLASAISGILFILLAPGNYGLRLLSIVIPGLDPVGSSDQRKGLLLRSIVVTTRNPWGIGMGNSPIMNDSNLQWHNAYMQVASELTVFGLAAYLVFLISPLRKLAAIERALYAKSDFDWFYYLSIGLQASIVGYMISSFFVSVAYNWFIYYIIAYAVVFRRIYRLEKNIKVEDENKSLFGWQSA